VSNTISVNIQKEVKPAILEIVEGSVRFVDPSGNNAIDANETCRILFAVKNTGVGDGYNGVARIKGIGSTTGVSFTDKKLSTIKVGSVMNIELPIVASMNTVDGNVNFMISVDEPMGFGTGDVELTVNTRQFVSPLLQVVDYTITGTSGSVLEKKQPFDLQLLLQNVKPGLAENVDVKISYPQGVFLLGGNEQEKFSTIAAGETKSLEYSFIVNQNYTQNEIPIDVKITERYGKYAENKRVVLKLNQTLQTKILLNT
jgi:hypothetical protein